MIELTEGSDTLFWLREIKTAFDAGKAYEQNDPLDSFKITADVAYYLRLLGHALIERYPDLPLPEMFGSKEAPVYSPLRASREHFIGLFRYFRMEVAEDFPPV